MDADLAAELYASGLTTSEVGERLGVSASTVRVHLKRAGVEMRKAALVGLPAGPSTNAPAEALLEPSTSGMKSSPTPSGVARR